MRPQRLAGALLILFLVSSAQVESLDDCISDCDTLQHGGDPLDIGRPEGPVEPGRQAAKFANERTRDPRFRGFRRHHRQDRPIPLWRHEPVHEASYGEGRGDRRHPLDRRAASEERQIDRGFGHDWHHFRAAIITATPLRRIPAAPKMIWTTSAREKLRSGTTSDEPGSTFRPGSYSFISPLGVTSFT